MVARGETSGRHVAFFLIAHWRCAENSVRAPSAQKLGRPGPDVSRLATFCSPLRGGLLQAASCFYEHDANESAFFV